MELEQALRNYLFRSYKLNLSFKESQHITDLTILNNGPDINKTVIHRDELKEALNPFLAVIEDQILETLEKAGNHPRIDKVIMNGCYFTGGGSGIDWITERLSLNGKINIHKSPDPFLDNINGLKEIIKAPEKFKDYLMV